MDIKERAFAGVRRYVEQILGFEIIDERPQDDLFSFVAYDGEENSLVFIGFEYVDWREDMSKTDFNPIARYQFEIAVGKFLSSEEADKWQDTPIRYDIVQIRVLGEHRALIAHCVNSKFKED